MINTYGKCANTLCMCVTKSDLDPIKYRYSPINGKLISLEHTLTFTDLQHQLIGVGRLLLLQDCSQACVCAHMGFQVETLIKHLHLHPMPITSLNPFLTSFPTSSVQEHHLLWSLLLLLFLFLSLLLVSSSVSILGLSPVPVLIPPLPPISHIFFLCVSRMLQFEWRFVYMYAYLCVS